MSILLDNDISLTKDNFEDSICVGLRKDQIMMRFKKTHKEMDEWVVATYGGGNFDSVFDYIRVNGINKYLLACYELGIRGNPGAMGIMNKLLLEMNEKQNEVVSVRFVNNIDGTERGETNGAGTKTSENNNESSTNRTEQLGEKK